MGYDIMYIYVIREMCQHQPPFVMTVAALFGDARALQPQR